MERDADGAAADVALLAMLEVDGQPAITDHYRFAIARPELDGLLVAQRTPHEVEDLAAALERGPLTGEEEAYLIDVAAVARGDARVVPE